MGNLRMTARRQAAVALSYEPEKETAPRILAAGYGETARRILELARQHQVHIHHDDTLASLLASVPVGSNIPESAYQLVADLLVFLYQMDQKMAAKITGNSGKNFR